MSRLWWKDDAAEEASTAAVQGLAASRQKERDPPPPTEEQRARVNISLKSFKDAVDKPDPAQEAARKARQAEIDAKRAAAEEHNRRMDYLMQGFEPPTNKHGITMSLSLARAIGTALVKRKPAPAPRDDFSPNEQ